MADHTPSRHEKSLGLLTTKFVSLLQEADDGVLDLKQAADSLNVKQKRRIYDITNVLEGIGLIEKKSKNSIQWKGAGPGCNSAEMNTRVGTLKRDIAHLEAQEKMLDQHKSWVTQSIKNVTDDHSNHQYAYVTHEDICRCFKDDTLLAIQAPSGTQLEVPIPEGPPNQKKKYQIHLKSHTGPIFVLLVNKETETSSPVVVQVPPPNTQTSSAPTSEEEESDASGAGASGDSQNLNPTTSAGAAKRIKTEPGVMKQSPKSPLRPSQERMATRNSPRNRDLSALLPPDGATAADPLRDMPSDMFFDPARDGELIDELMSTEMFAPLLRLSPPPSDKDYYFNLDDSEGVCDLFDVPLV